MKQTFVEQFGLHSIQNVFLCCIGQCGAFLILHNPVQSSCAVHQGVQAMDRTGGAETVKLANLRTGNPAGAAVEAETT